MSRDAQNVCAITIVGTVLNRDDGDVDENFTSACNLGPVYKTSQPGLPSSRLRPIFFGRISIRFVTLSLP